VCVYIKLGYGVRRTTDDSCATDRFFVFKIQMVDPTSQNISHIKKSSWR
jgi:hypothetical protein